MEQFQLKGTVKVSPSEYASLYLPNTQEFPQYRAVFFDLDGTLLPMDIEEFMNEYFASLARFMAARGQDPEQFSCALMAGSAAMMDHDSALSNEEAFFQTFYQQIDRDVFN